MWVYALALLLLGLLPFWGGPRPLGLDLRGSATDMGRDQGRAWRRRIRLLSDLYLKRTVCGNRDEVLRRGCAAAAALRVRIDPRQAEELHALAAAAGIPPDLALFGNSFIDLGYAGGACRTVVRTADPAGLLHGHNLDWDSVAGLANWNIAIIRRTPADGRHATVAIAMPGMVGALDIINERGLALSLNLVGSRGPSAAEPGFVLLRRVAETCGTFAEARTALLAVPPGLPFSVTVSAAAERRAAVFEPWPEGLRERLPVDALLTADNDTWAGDDLGRCRVDRAVRALPGTGLAGMQAALRHPDVLIACNLYSVVFDFAGNRLHLASGHTPAAPGRYRSYPLFPPRRPP